MFDGDGFGVGLTVAPLDVDVPGARAPEGVQVRPSRLSEVLPPQGRSRAGKAWELARVQRLKARMYAYEAAVTCGFADDTPETDDRLMGAPGTASPDWAPVDEGPAGVSEFFVDEFAAYLGTSVTSASREWVVQSTLYRRLPGTWAAMADGELDLSRGKAIAAEVATTPQTEPMVLLAVEAAVLPRATELTVTRLRALVRAELVAHDAAFAERRRRWAERHADATVRQDVETPGRARFGADMSTEDAHACWDVADRMARAAKAAGDPRPIGVLRAEAVRDRMLGPEGEVPPIAAHVTVIAPLDALEQGARPDRDDLVPTVVLVDADADDGQTDEERDAGADDGPSSDGATFSIIRPDGRPVPGVTDAPDPTGRRTPIGEVAGEPITAGHLWTLLCRVDAVCPGGLQEPTGGTLQFALTDPDGALRALLSRPELERLVRRGCAEHPPDPDGGTSTCDCGLVDRPPEVDRYRPSAPQYRFIRARDRRCRMPGCTARRRLGRPRSRRPARLRWRDRLRQPLLPVPAPSPAEDLRPWLDLRLRTGRHAGRHHTDDDHPDQPTTRIATRPGPRRRCGFHADRTGTTPTDP